MDFGTILGIIAGATLIIMGISGLTKDFAMFLDLPSILIVVGGSFASTNPDCRGWLICFDND